MMSSAAAACWKRARPVLLKHFLPIGLVLAIVVGLAVPQVGSALASVHVGKYGVFQTLFVVIIFIVSGLTLNTDDVKKALRAWKATLFGVVSILFITPLLALVPQQLPFLPAEFQTGLLLFCTMPTTINSGVALANAAKGNFALALMLTVLSNLLGIFTAPFFLSLLLAVGGIRIDPLPLLTNLLLTLLLPLVVGKALRELLAARVLPFLKKHKTLIGNFSSLCLICIPWMKLSVSQPALLALSAAEIAALIGCGLTIHAIYLAFNFAFATYVLRCPLDIKKSIVIMGSQKTLPMAMTVLSFFPPSLGEGGLIAIPCILSHLVQIFVDAFLAAKWAHVVDAPSAGSVTAVEGVPVVATPNTELAEAPLSPNRGAEGSDSVAHCASG